ncbi:hypothetical protein RRF57_000675 [Xylaria bambusicola]|uniref:SRR1-like domain-containing protein n=1 Tax=Xylaria bambusicola TaxID=326684 RepID=A0AAN7UF03_9PEZI
MNPAILGIVRTYCPPASIVILLPSLKLRIMESLGDLAAALPGDEDTQVSRLDPSVVHDFLLRLRQAYESDRPLYPLNHIKELLDFAAFYNSLPYGLDPSYIGLDYFGDEKCWTFSESALKFANLDLSPIQWLICMPHFCSHSTNLLTRAFSLHPTGYRNSLHSGIRRNDDRTRYFQRELIDAQQIWKQSNYKSRVEYALARAFVDCYAHSHQPFTKILAIGLGCLGALDPNEWVFGQQHAFVLYLSQELQGSRPNLPKIEVIFQDQGYDIDMKTALEMQGSTIKVVGDNNFEHVFSVDDNTLLIALNYLTFPLKQIIAEYATATPCAQRLPKAIIWEQGAPVTWEEMETLATQLKASNNNQYKFEWHQDTPRTNRLEELYNNFEFPVWQLEDDEGDPFEENTKLAIYVRKQQ